MLDGFSFSDDGPLQRKDGQIRISVSADDVDFAIQLIRMHQEQHRRAMRKVILNQPWDVLILDIDPVVLCQAVGETEAKE